MQPSYSTNDPRGWCGDPSRGAALGRATIIETDPSTFSGRFTLRRIRLFGDYDSLGTYWGNTGQPLYWYAADDADGNTLVDAVTRAWTREEAKDIIRGKFPHARFYR